MHAAWLLCCGAPSLQAAAHTLILAPASCLPPPKARALRSQLLQVEDDIVRVRDQVDVTNKE
jgi:hypothetical protein